MLELNESTSLYENEDEYRVEIKIKNNLLYNKIMSNYKSIKKFCEINCIDSTYIYNLLNFKQPLYNKDGTLKAILVKLQNIFNCTLAEIIPENYESHIQNKFIKTVSFDELSQLSNDYIAPLLTYTPEEDLMETEQLNFFINKLAPKEKDIINDIFYNNLSVQEVAIKHNVTRTLINFYKKRALYKLRLFCVREKNKDKIPSPTIFFSKCNDFINNIAKENNCTIYTNNYGESGFFRFFEYHKKDPYNILQRYFHIDINDEFYVYDNEKAKKRRTKININDEKYIYFKLFKVAISEVFVTHKQVFIDNNTIKVHESEFTSDLFDYVAITYHYYLSNEMKKRRN